MRIIFGKYIELRQDLPKVQGMDLALFDVAMPPYEWYTSCCCCWPSIKTIDINPRKYICAQGIRWGGDGDGGDGNIVHHLSFREMVDSI